MTNLVINSDDFGYSKAISRGIVESHLNGVLTSTTLMANMPGFEDAIKLGKDTPKLGIGVHLTLTCGKPILSNMDSLTMENGYFTSLNELKKNLFSIDLDQLFLEWDAQIRKVRNSGIAISHLDSHHYVHSMGDNHQVIEQLATKYQLPVRNCFSVKDKIIQKKYCPMDDFWNLFNYPEMKKMDSEYDLVKKRLFEILENDAEHYSKYNNIEAVCHPGYLDTTIWFGSSFNLARMREIEILCDLNFKNLLAHYDYKLLNYHNYVVI